jgi:type II secretory pathway pseudopilin PulG
LIEMLVVLVLIGLMAGIVTVSLAGQLQRLESQQMLERIAGFDQATRTLAERRGEPMRLKVNLARGRLDRTTRRGKPIGKPMQLPERFTLESMLIGGRNRQTVSATIPITHRGWSRSYALRVSEHAREDHWLVVAGLSGQTQEVQDAKAAKQWLSQ